MSDPIDALVRDLSPVVPRSSLRITAAWVASATLFGLASVLFILGWRSDWIEVRFSLSYWLAGGALALTLFTAARLGICLSMPGARVSPGLRLAPGAGLVLTLVMFVILHVTSGNAGDLATGLAATGWSCSVALAALSILPGLLLLTFMRRLAVTEPAGAATALGMAMGAAGAMAIGCHCDSTNAAHLLVFHGVPLMLMPVVIRLVGKRLLRW